jgi:hypothetical protein
MGGALGAGLSVVVPRKEGGGGLEELVEGRRALENHMVVARQLGEVGAWDEPRHQAASSRGDTRSPRQ